MIWLPAFKVNTTNVNRALLIESLTLFIIVKLDLCNSLCRCREHEIKILGQISFRPFSILKMVKLANLWSITLACLSCAHTRRFLIVRMTINVLKSETIRIT